MALMASGSVAKRRADTAASIAAPSTTASGSSGSNRGRCSASACSCASVCPNVHNICQWCSRRINWSLRFFATNMFFFVGIFVLKSRLHRCKNEQHMYICAAYLHVCSGLYVCMYAWMCVCYAHIRLRRHRYNSASHLQPYFILASSSAYTYTSNFVALTLHHIYYMACSIRNCLDCCKIYLHGCVYACAPHVWVCIYECMYARMWVCAHASMYVRITCWAGTRTVCAKSCTHIHAYKHLGKDSHNMSKVNPLTTHTHTQTQCKHTNKQKLKMTYTHT